MPRLLSLTICLFCLGFAGFPVALAQPDSPLSATSGPIPATAPLTGAEMSLRLRTAVVSLNVNVIDRKGLPVVGLGPEQFELYEDGVRQSLEYFRLTDGPASIGVVLDVSGSMQFSLAEAQAAMGAFLAASHPDDEFFLLLVQEQPQVVTDFTDGETVLRRMASLQAKGDTALRDALALGLRRLDQARHQRRALLVLSDGIDNHSRLEARELFAQMKESKAQIYAIGTAEFRGATCDTRCRLGAQQLLEASARQTGGEAFFLTARQSLEDTTTRIALLLRQQYSLGYVPTNEARQGRWRKVAVKVTNSEQKTLIRSRRGYYEPREDAGTELSLLQVAPPPGAR